LVGDLEPADPASPLAVAVVAPVPLALVPLYESPPQPTIRMATTATTLRAIFNRMVRASVT
jgi:hypothetical protein